MKIRYLFLGFALTLTACSKPVHVTPTPVPQEAESRLVTKKVALNVENAIPFIDSLVIDPRKIYMRDEFLYVLDEGDFTVKKFDQNGKFITSYGKGKGEGPGEFSKPRTLFVDQQESVWVGDAKKYRIVQFDKNGKPIKHLNVESSIYDLAINNAGTIAVRLNIMNIPYLFDFLSLDKNDKRAINIHFGGNWIEDQETFHAVVLTGNMLTAPEKEEFYYVGFYDGWLHRSTFDGEELFLRNLIGNHSILTVTQGNDRMIKGLDAAHAVQALSSIIEGQLFVFALTDTMTDNSKAFVDVYDAENGDYLYSMSVEIGEDACHFLYVTEDYLLASCEEGISKFAVETV